MQAVAGEPAQRKRRSIGATQNDCTGPFQIGDDRAVLAGDIILLNPQPVGGGPSHLIDIDLHRHWHTGQRPGILAARQGRVHCLCGRERGSRVMCDHRVDTRIDGVEAGKRGQRRLPRRGLA